MVTESGVTTMVTSGIEHRSVAELQSFLAAHPDVRFIRFYFSEYSGLLRQRSTTTARALQMASSPKNGITTGGPLSHLGLQSGGVLEEIFEIGDWVWLPDWTSLKAFGASPGTAMVQCYVEERRPGQEVSTATDSRCVLQRAVRNAKTKHDVEFLVGLEIEFYLVEKPDATATIPTPGNVWTPGTVRVPNWKVVEEVVTLLEAAGVHVWAFHPEGGSSKYEVSLSPLPPVEAVDALLFAQETIKTVAFNHGVHATMHPKAFETGPTAGQHIHLSLSRPEAGSGFLAGVLKHFRSLAALMMSNIDSYQRSGQFGGGAICWGWNNKLTCVRRCEEAYFEIRPPDAMANAYLLLAGVIGVGLRGFEDKEEPSSESVTDFLIEAPTAEQRKKFNITQDLPKDLAESIEEFKHDTVMKEVLGQKCHEAYVYNKEKDYAACKKMSTAERRAIAMQEQ